MPSQSRDFEKKEKGPLELQSGEREMPEPHPVSSLSLSSRSKSSGTSNTTNRSMREPDTFVSDSEVAPLLYPGSSQGSILGPHPSQAHLLPLTPA